MTGTRRVSHGGQRYVAVALATAMILVGTAALSGCGSLSPVTAPASFDHPLRIPPLADSTIDENGTRVFELTAQAGTTEFEPGVSTATMAILLAGALALVLARLRRTGPRRDEVHPPAPERTRVFSQTTGGGG